MSWIKYGAFFSLVFVVFMFIAYQAALNPWWHSSDVLSLYIDYADDSGSHLTLSKKSIAFIRGPKVYRLSGYWTNHRFYSEIPHGSGAEAIVAQELPNEDLEVDLAYFSDDLAGKTTYVKAVRLPFEHHPYPVREYGQNVSYPPPKGLIKVGMLEADLRTLPWQPTMIVEPQYVIDATVHSNEYNGTHLTNAWPMVYHYKSDDSHLQELQVTVEKGRVIQVTGGAEESDVPSYFPPENTAAQPDSNDDDVGQKSWAEWLFNWIFSK